MGLFRRSHSPHWWVSFSNCGRQYRLSTGTADRRLAEKIAATVRLQVDSEQWFPSSPAQTKTVQELLGRYLVEHADRNKRPSSAKRDRGLAKHLLAAFGSLPLVEVTPERLADYKSSRRAEGGAARTVNMELALGRHAFNLAMREWRWCTLNPFTMVRREREAALCERWLTAGEEEQLLAVCLPWLRNLVTMALHTGMRLGEILSLRWALVDLVHRRVMVQTVLAKTARARTIPLNETARLLLAVHALSSSPEPGSLVFGTSCGTEHTGSNVNRAFRLAVKRAKIAPVRFHDLRHTFATRLAQNDVDLYRIQRLLGHTSPTMTQRYAHHSTGSLAPAVSRLDTLRKEDPARASTNLAHGL